MLDTNTTMLLNPRGAGLRSIVSVRLDHVRYYLGPLQLAVKAFSLMQVCINLWILVQQPRF